MPQKAKIVFAGGCHLAGYPVGQGEALSSVALGALGYSSEVAPMVIPYLTLRSQEALLLLCRECEAEFLVLQVGHYETMPKFGKILRIKRMAEFFSPSSHSEPFVADPERQYHPTLGTRLVYLRRLMAMVVLTALGLRGQIMRTRQIEGALDELLGCVPRPSVKEIFLMSPFSCPDPVTRACRRRVQAIFAAAAARHGCRFVDSFLLLESYGRGAAFRENFADPAHLSKLGHERVGLHLGEAIRAVLESR